MLRRVSLGLFIALILATPGVATAKEFDVCIYGGTPGGIVAAVTAAREGSSVLVVEPTKWVGGMVTGGLTSTDVGKPETIGGVAREFFARAAARYDGQHMWDAEPHVNMETFQAMLREAGVQVITGRRLTSVALAGKRIVSFTTDDGATRRGKMFIDATYEGDLMAGAGVRYIVGRESRETYGEPLAGFYPMPIRPRSDDVMDSVCSCLGGKGPHYIHGTPTQLSARDAQGRLLFGVTEDHNQPGAADKLTQAYNFRVVVTRRPEIRVPFPRPEKYDPARYELLLRLIKAYPAVRFGRLVHLGQVAGGKFDLNAQGLVSTDYAGANAAYPDGDLATRERIWQDHVDYVQGYLWFLGNDQRVPRALRDEVNEWGLCRDEFTDNANWPYALYVREARRMIGDYVMRQKDCQTEIIKPDSVGMGSFVIDCHIVQRLANEDGSVIDEGSFPDAPALPYQISYRSLTPKRAECENLLVPVCLSASHIAYCSLRMEPVYMALGQASGLAATMAIKSEQAVQAIDVATLRARLREQKAVLELKGLAAISWARDLAGIVVDDDSAEFTGAWQGSSYGNPLNGTGHHDLDSDKGRKSASFKLQVPQPGKYEVRFSYAPAANRASNVPITVLHADGLESVVVNEKLPPTLEKHFVSLGTFRFTPDKPCLVVVRTGGTDGYVGVDAVQLLPVK
jgi:hypothetical protein